MERKGHWATHEYPQRMSIDDILTFVGWDTIQSIVDACERQHYDEWRCDSSYCIERDKALIATLFLTGGRVNEVLSLRRENFNFSNPEYITVSGMLLEKIFRKVRAYIEVLDEPPRKNVFASLYIPKLLDDGRTVWTRKRWETEIHSRRVKERRIRRSFPVFKDEPLVNILTERVQSSEGLLFPSLDIRRRGKPITSVRAWQIVNNVGEICNIKLWNHFFRIQRASQLFYGYNLTWEELKLWFSWVTDVMAEKYARGSVEDLADRMMKRRETVRQGINM